MHALTINAQNTKIDRDLGMVKLYLCYQDNGGFVLQSKHRLLLDMQIECQRAIVSIIRENSSLTPNNVIPV